MTLLLPISLIAPPSPPLFFATTGTYWNLRKFVEELVEQNGQANILALVTSAEKEKMKECLDLLSTRSRVDKRIIRLSAMHQRTLHVSLSLARLADPYGKTLLCAGVGRFISDLQKLRSALVQKQKLSALGVMAEGIAHEIRNPLTAASAAAQFLMDYEEDDPEFVKECSKRIYDGLNKVSEIIDSLLRFSRNSFPLIDMDELDMREVITEAVRSFEHKTARQNIELVTDLPDEPVPVNGQESLLQQMMAEPDPQLSERHARRRKD
ncbi:MAG: histidine kinase dimerization/phospho-acceptor domain-containing protein [Planctomycetota bacterium]|nr:histidine kinase dimerization/phospho-acceptor domain-containing protein [Planctomycetota bacterium]